MMNLFTARKYLSGLFVLCALATVTITNFAIVTRYSTSSAGLQDIQSLYGNWTGNSICQVKESPCHDEEALYIVAKSDAPDKVRVTADKIVDGKPEEMGTLDFAYDSKTGVLYAKYKYG